MDEIKTIRKQLTNLSYYRREAELMQKLTREMEGNSRAKELHHRLESLLGQIADHAQQLADRREELDAQLEHEVERGLVQDRGGSEEARPEPGGEAEGLPDVPAPVSPRTNTVPNPSLDPAPDEGRAQRKKEGRK